MFFGDSISQEEFAYPKVDVWVPDSAVLRDTLGELGLLSSTLCFFAPGQFLFLLREREESDQVGISLCLQL